MRSDAEISELSQAIVSDLQNANFNDICNHIPSDFVFGLIEDVIAACNRSLSVDAAIKHISTVEKLAHKVKAEVIGEMLRDDGFLEKLAQTISKHQESTAIDLHGKGGEIAIGFSQLGSLDRIEFMRDMLKAMTNDEITDMLAEIMRT